MNKSIFLALLVFGLLSCGGNDSKESDKTDKTETVVTPTVNENEKSVKSNPVPQIGEVNLNTSNGGEQVPLPNIEDLISIEQVEEALGLPGGTVYEIKSSGKATSRSRATFFRTADPEKGNAAILLQVSNNPLPEEFTDWAFFYIDNKKSDGERTLNSTEPIKYEDFDAGLNGAASKEQGKYFWRDAKNHVYMLVFNVTKTEDEMYRSAQKISKIITPK